MENPSTPVSPPMKPGPPPPPLPVGTPATTSTPPTPKIIGGEARQGPPAAKPSVPSPAHDARSEATVDTIPEGEVVIRTMYDDIADLQANPPAKRSTPNVPLKSLPAATPLKASTGRNFPLPPKKAGNKQKVILAPAVTRRKFGGLKWLTLLILVIGLVGGAAAAWVFYFQDVSFPTPQVSTTDVTSVLPAESLLVLQYAVATPEDRAAVAAAWATSAATPSATTLVAGDPRWLLNQADVTELYFVVLENTPRPYVIVPKTQHVTSAFETETGFQVAERDGWYIIHALSTEAYEAAVAERSLAAAGSAPLFTQSTGNGPVRLLLGPAALTLLRGNVAGQNFLAGQLQELQATGTFSADGRLTLSGVGQTVEQATTPTDTDPTLLGFLPSSTAFAHLGSNFYQELTQWNTLGSVLNDDLLSGPLVQQLISQLTGPYLFFTTHPDTASASLGLVIALPPSLQRTLTLSEPSLEQAIPALTPLILDRQTVAPQVFTEVVVNGVPLRYANIVGSSQALDYALVNGYLVIATSKDTMLALVAQVAQPPVPPAHAWTHLVSELEVPLSGTRLTVGSFHVPSLNELLPNSEARLAVPFALVGNQNVGAPLTVQIVLDAGQGSANSPVPTPTLSVAPTDTPSASAGSNSVEEVAPIPSELLDDTGEILYEP